VCSGARCSRVDLVRAVINRVMHLKWAWPDARRATKERVDGCSALGQRRLVGKSRRFSRDSSGIECSTRNFVEC
jgi:hypothetical protein